MNRDLEEADSFLFTAWELALMALTTLELIYSDAVLKGMNIALDFSTVGGGRLEGGRFGHLMLRE